MGKEIFETRKIDEDTRILSTDYMNRDEHDLLVEIWAFDGIKGKSLIFVSPQISSMTDEAIREYAFHLLGLPENEKWTLKRNDDFTFFNYGFKA